MDHAPDHGSRCHLTRLERVLKGFCDHFWSDAGRKRIPGASRLDMLLRFTAQNYLSLRDKQELSLVASTLIGPEEALIEGPASSKERYLPTLIVYGANASGKSNMLRALNFLRDAIILSYGVGSPKRAIPRAVFALKDESASDPTIMTIDFIIDGARYHYGFKCNDTAFIEEWLYSFPNGRQIKLYERNGQEFSFGRALKGRNVVISDLTRPNSLFFSAAVSNRHNEITRLSAFFDSLHFDDEMSVSGIAASRQLKGVEVDRRVIEFLGNIGTGVIDYRKTEYDLSPRARELTNVLSPFLKEIAPNSDIIEDLSSDKRTQVELAHQTWHKQKVFFDLSNESEGTRRLLLLLGPIFSALDNGSCIVIDELNASLHTMACEKIVEFFHDKEVNRNGAQLIATTHDTNLLRSSLLRRDQIWFSEKDDDGASITYPLTDIQTRQSDNLEKGYLQGRYGAVPFAGGITKLTGNTDGDSKD